MKKDRKKFSRMCVSCRQLKSKQELIRVVKDEDKGLIIDSSYKIQKRGAYVCKDKKCILGLKKANKLGRQFGLEVDQLFYQELENFLER